MNEEDVKREISYFYSIKIIDGKLFYLCRYCGETFKRTSSKHMMKYHMDERDFTEHIKAHKDKKCNCSGVVYEN